MQSTKILISFFLVINLVTAHMITQRVIGQEEHTFPFQPTDPVITDAIAYLKNQQQSSGSIAGLSVSAWSAMALSAAQEDISEWDTLKNYLKEKINTLYKATEWERHCLAIIALKENPYSCNGVNLAGTIRNFFDGTQMGDPANLYDDLFGMLSLRACNMKPTDSIIQTLKQNILNAQKSNGGWGDVDTTAIAIMALATSEDTSSTPIQQALAFIKTKQSDNGGFSSWGTSNTASTAWAIGAIVAAGDNPQSDSWCINGTSPIDFLLSLQQPDGSFNWSPSSNMNPEWMTAYVLPALLGKPYPVNYWESDSGSGGEQNDDSAEDGSSDDSNDDDPPPTEPEKPNEKSITLLCPQNHTLYILNKKMPHKIQNLIIIGPIDIKLNTSPKVKCVEFHLNNHVSFRDEKPPFIWRLNVGVILRKMNLTIKAYLDPDCYYETQLQQCLENIASMLLRMQNTSTLQAIIENITSLNQIEFPHCVHLHQEFLYINPLPTISLRILESDRD